MIIKWEEKDVIPGITVGKILKGEEFIIGYTVWHGSQVKPRSNLCMISLRDGAVYKPGTRAELADTLSKGNYIPTIVLGLYKGVKNV